MSEGTPHTGEKCSNGLQAAKYNKRRGQRVAGGELRHLIGLPGGGGDMGLCHTLIRVHTV